MPKISIIIPMLNSEKYLRECMDSVVNQTLKDIEIIAVDAGSTDKTVELLKEYIRNDSRIRIIFSEKKSVGYQYNLGIEAARGEYVGFVESDDYVVPDMYEILLDKAQKYGVDWIKANYFYFMDYPKVGRQFIPVNDEKFCKVNEVFAPCLCPRQYVQEIFMWRGIYRTDFIKSNHIRLNETFGAAFQDTGFVLQVFMYAEKALYIDECLYCYRRDNQNSSSHQANTIRYEIDEVEYISKIIKENPALYEAFGIVNYERSVRRFLSAYERVPAFSECPEEILYAVRHYRDFLLDQNDSLGDITQVLEEQRELVWLKAGVEEFDVRYREINDSSERALRKMISKILKHNKLIIFGCGDNGSGILSLLLRHNVNEILCMSDNDEKKWNRKHMGIHIVPPKEIKLDKETIVLVANKRYFSEIRAQLLSLGISAEQIWLAPQIMQYRGTNLMLDGDILPVK